MKVPTLVFTLIAIVILQRGQAADDDRSHPSKLHRNPTSFQLRCEDQDVVKAYGMALRIVDGNIKPWKRGMLQEERPAIMAGAGYASPWTRDASYNTYFGAGLVYPEVARNTLLSVLVEYKPGEGWRIGGQYWDCVSWVTGAWAYITFTGDENFQRLAFSVAANSLAYFRAREFDEATGLFCGPGWSDGIAGYPKPYDQAGGSSFILDYVKHNKHVDKIRMKAISTNCLYYNAYRLTARMGKRIGMSEKTCAALHAKARDLRSAINKHLWLEKAGHYAYYLDSDGRLDPHQEGLGHAFAILFGVADHEQSERIFKNQYISTHGIPCVWPLFPRFRKAVGRHCGAVWPQIQGFWAVSAASRGELDILDREFRCLTNLALASGDFREIYHPETGEPYGGMQVGRLWRSEHKQTWAATAYLAMLLRGIFGMRFEPDGILFQPLVPKRLGTVVLENMEYRGKKIEITLRGSGRKIDAFLLDGKPRAEPKLPASMSGREHAIEIRMR